MWVGFELLICIKVFVIIIKWLLQFINKRNCGYITGISSQLEQAERDRVEAEKQRERQNAIADIENIKIADENHCRSVQVASHESSKLNSLIKAAPTNLPKHQNSPNVNSLQNHKQKPMKETRKGQHHSSQQLM